MKTLLLVAALALSTGCAFIEDLKIPTQEFPTFVHDDGTPYTAKQIQEYAYAMNLASIGIIVPQMHCVPNYGCISL